MIGRNQWPDFVPRMPTVLSQYFEACMALGKRLLKVFAVALKVNPEYFTAAIEHTISRGSIL
jgi:isopenicillin N synthase-like dioxygenase